MEKKLYIQPSVDQTQLMPSAIVLAGSPAPGNVDLGGGGGNTVDPD